ncbi:MAG: TolC family protein [Oligoflexia bacterium]|nr:TolC family protein [Oligoflexia bacterium]
MTASRLLCLLIFSLTCINLGCSVAAAEEGAPGGYTLERSLATALEHNYDLRQAKERLQRQHGVVVEVRGRLMPALIASATASRTDNDRIESLNGQRFGSQDAWVAKVEVSQPIFAGGALVSDYKRQRFNEKAAAHDMEAAVQGVIFSVKENFYRALLAQAQVKVQQEQVGLLEEELKSETQKRDAGSVSDFNVLRSEVELANAQAPLIRARNNARLTVEDLRRVMGLDAGVNADGAGEIEISGELKPVFSGLTLEQALTLAEERRPELLQLRNALDAEKEGIRVAWGGYLPQIAAYANYGAQKRAFSEEFDDHIDGWEVGVRSEWRIFDSLENAGRITQARSSARLAELQLAKTKTDVQVDVRRAYSSLTEAKELVVASQKVVEQARESLRLAKARFDVGAATQLDVLNTQVALVDARTNEVQALSDCAVALARLERATGQEVTS